MLFSYLDEAFKTLDIFPRDLFGIGIVIGPGMFTSLRVGLSCAKGLAVNDQIPIQAFKTLDALYFSVPENIRHGQNKIIPIIDIRRNELYYQVFQAGKPTSEAQITTPKTFARNIPEDSVLLGSGLRNYLELFKTHALNKFTALETYHPLPDAVALNAKQSIIDNDITDTTYLVPFYIRSV